MRLLVVEDDDALAAALSEGLGEDRFAVDLAGSAERAQEQLEQNEYDLVLLDLGLPGIDGMTLLRSLRASENTIPVLILTARGEITDRVAGLDAGADDYMQKPFAFPELLARVRALLRRGSSPAATVLRVCDLDLDPIRFEARRNGTPIPLTTKEFAILEYMMRHAGELVTRATLLEHCWDNSYEGSSNLVDVHVGRVRRKLNAAGGPTILHSIRGAGFILGDRR